MPKFTLKEGFQPSRDTKFWLRFTRKSSAVYAGVTLPGLFQTSQFHLDTIAVLIIVLGEAYGLYNLFIVGQISLFYVVGLFFADMIFAISAHIWRGKICLAGNHKVLTDDQDIQARYDRQIRRWELLSNFFRTLIVIIAAFKIMSFYALQGGLFDGLTLAILLSYGVVAIFHITSTGYFLSEMLVMILVARERSAFLSNINDSPFRVKTPLKLTFESTIPLIDSVAGRHKFYKKQDAQNNSTYTLETFGILEDSQLHALIMQQERQDQKRTLAITGLQHQVENILQYDPGTELRIKKE